MSGGNEGLGAALLRYQFSAAERHAIFTTHGNKCYLGSEPIDMASFHVDHVLPESLLDDPKELAGALVLLGLPADFDVNSFENWLPACPACNTKKQNSLWRPTPMTQLVLDRARNKAAIAATSAAKVVTTQRIGAALITLAKAYDDGVLTDASKETLRVLAADYALAQNLPADTTEIVTLLPGYSVRLYKVLSDDKSIEVVSGPYGVGGGPSSTSGRLIEGGMRCSCGSQWFNGARCVICGELLDD
jgi:hypothetical protein